MSGHTYKHIRSETWGREKDGVSALIKKRKECNGIEIITGVQRKVGTEKDGLR